MAPQCLLKHHYQCCGVQINYFEQCGHTTTEGDHHPTCGYHKPNNNKYLSPLEALLQPRQLTPSTSPAPHQPFPQPYPKCRDLHRYIHLLTSKCPACTNSLQTGSLDPNISQFAITWSPLSEAEIFERGVYWLNEMLLARREAYQGALADWEAGMRERWEVDTAFDIPLLERTYGYDPAGVKGDFLKSVERGGGETKGRERKCGACHGEMGNVMVRRLPCGCVLHLKCIRRCFAGGKDCPGCGVGFKLVKIPRREDPNGKEKGESYYPIWEDDGYVNFI